jgi:hypothetical protein
VIGGGDGGGGGGGAGGRIISTGAAIKIDTSAPVAFARASGMASARNCALSLDWRPSDCEPGSVIMTWPTSAITLGCSTVMPHVGNPSSAASTETYTVGGVSN